MKLPGWEYVIIKYLMLNFGVSVTCPSWSANPILKSEMLTLRIITRLC